MKPDFMLECPTPLRHESVQLAHGGGGRLSRELVERFFLPAFGHAALQARHDSAVFEVPRGRLAMTTDSYVVRPMFFPGGDIGRLAVCGTVNDLAMAGAKPLYLSAAFILEEGLPLNDLRRVCASMKQAAEESGVAIITGDTKVVDRGKGDGVFVTTTGVGVVPEGLSIAPSEVCPGDVVIVSGDIGRHGVAVLSVRESLCLEGPIESDNAPLASLVAALLEAGVAPRCLRDPTRGGLASALCEIAMDGGVDIEIDETLEPVGDVVRGACELFGLDPLYVACEGRLVAFVREEDETRALDVLRGSLVGTNACSIGRVLGRRPASRAGRVTSRSPLGSSRTIDLFAGEQLPRIC